MTTHAFNTNPSTINAPAGAQSIIPMFDEDSPDVAILAAHERVRSARAYVFGFDDLPDDRQPADELELCIQQSFADEDFVFGTSARTLPGVVARLSAVIPAINQDRWVERVMVEGGPLALVRKREDLDGHTQQLIDVVTDLIRIEWDAALAEYERSVGDFNLALRFKSVVEEEEHRTCRAGEQPSQLTKDLGELVAQSEARFSNDAQIRRLLRTLTPDLPAYRRKVEIAVAEGYQQDAAVWLGRDTSHLMGAIATASGQRVLTEGDA